jgi:hypothetical protein
MTQHTEGPWEVIEYSAESAAVRIGNDVIQGAYKGGNEDNLRLEDARLIAAAPDLLAALQGIRDEIERYFGKGVGGPMYPKFFDSVMHHVGSVIAKATPNP